MLPDFVAEPLVPIPRLVPMPGQLPLPVFSDLKDPPMSATKAAAKKTSNAEPPKKRGRPRKIVPSEAFPVVESPIDRDGLLRRACLFLDGSVDRWARLVKGEQGATDLMILDLLAEEWSTGDRKEATGDDSTSWCVNGGAKPRIWLGMDTPHGKASLEGPALAQAVRRVMDIPDALTASARGRGRPKKQADAVSGPAPDAETAFAKLVTIEEKMIPIEKIFPSDENPREEFRKEDLERMGASIRDVGQLVPLLVREPVNGRYELIDGETRWRAAQSVEGVSALMAKVIRCSDADAANVRILSYIQRNDLNPIEEARGLKLLVEKYKVSQRELSKTTGISQGQISNRLRLLDLPKEFQSKIIAKEWTATDGRTLAAFSDRPHVLTKFVEEKAWNDSHDFGRGVEELLATAIRASSRSMTKGADGPKFKIDDETRAKLDIVEIKTERITEPRAFNVALWDELQAAARKAAEERAAAREQKKPAKATAVTLPIYKIEELWREWYGRRIAERFAGDLKKPDRERFERLALLFAAAADDHLFNGFGLSGDIRQPLTHLYKFTRDELLAQMCERLLQILADGMPYAFGELADLVCLGDELGIGLADFVPDVPMLAELPEAALDELLALWEGIKPGKDAKKRAAQLVEVWDPGWIPELFKLPDLDGVEI